jgi:hypothetical protein
LKKFKERVGYKEQANINDKFSDETDNPESESNDNERDIEEEEPVIVVLKQGDLSAEEVSKYKEENCNTGIVCRGIRYGLLSVEIFTSLYVEVFCVFLQIAGTAKTTNQYLKNQRNDRRVTKMSRKIEKKRKQMSKQLKTASYCHLTRMMMKGDC